MCLTGPSGVGKTTLALEVAAQLVAGGGAAGGCVWVDLAGARTWHDVEARLMIALGLIKVGERRGMCYGLLLETAYVFTRGNQQKRRGEGRVGQWG